MQCYAESVVNKALSFVGYLEKSNTNNLDDFTANAGQGNFTCFARDYAQDTGISVQGQPWCDVFADEMYIKTYGVAAARDLVYGFSAYTPTSAAAYQKAGRWTTGTPKPGYQIFYHNSTRICHTGIVISVDLKAGTVTTVEGNTSKANGLIANGGGVAKKTYKLDYARISGYGIPKGMSFDGTVSTPKSTNTGSKVSEVQSYLNNTIAAQLKNCDATGRALLKADGLVGKKTRAGITLGLQIYINALGKVKLVEDGQYGDKSHDAMPCFKVGDQSMGVQLVKSILICAGYSVDYNDKYDDACAAAVLKYQAARSLTKDKIFGPNCFDSYLRK